MSNNPDPKKAKLQEGEEDVSLEIDPAIVPFIQDIHNCQEKLTQIDDEEAELIRKVQDDSDAKRKPLLLQRASVISKIPGFWFRAIQNHDVSEYITPKDEQVMQSLVDIAMEDSINTLRFVFRFKPNDFFENGEIVKEFRATEDGQLEAIPFKIQWKKNKDLTDPRLQEQTPTAIAKNEPLKRPREVQSFFKWFSALTPFDDNDIVELLKELCLDPLRFYLGDEEGDEENEEASSDEDDDDDDDDDEEAH